MKYLILILLLCACQSGNQQGEVSMETQPDDSISAHDGELIFESSSYIGFVDPEKTVEIPISEYNTLNKDSEWELLDVYTKSNCRTSLWRNKETREELEVIGVSPPSKLLIIEADSSFHFEDTEQKGGDND